MSNVPAHATVGVNTKIHPSVVFGPHCKSITIGNGVMLSRDLYIDVEDLTIGDYTTIHHGTVIHGEKIEIGHNCWIGHYCILDGHGGMLSIGNNVGVGAQSQLWSHIKFGDVMAGCRWNSLDNLIIKDDVWIVGHGIVAAITIEERAMLMVGGVATKNMEANHVYAGTPARDMTDVFGPQFDEVDNTTKVERFRKLISEYKALGNDVSFIGISTAENFTKSTTQTFFDPASRVYQPRFDDAEMAFMKFLLYDKAKFLPIQL